MSAADLIGLFGHCLMLSLLAVGGAITTAPDMHRYLVIEHGWLNDAQFTTSVALAQAAPGPNLLFIAVLGWNVGGPLGALATMVGILLPSTLLTLAVTRWTASETGGLDATKNAEPSLVEIKSFDGLKMSGFLYRPDATKFPGKRPLIVTDKDLDLSMREADVAIRTRKPTQPDLIQRGGFPPVHLSEINFQAMYEQQQNQAAQSSDTATLPQ